MAHIWILLMRMNFMRKCSVIGLFIGLWIVGGGCISVKQKANPIIDQEALLERHNHYRSELGVAPLQWSDELAEYAQNWANKLAKSCDMYHSKGKFGENIYWTSGTATPAEVVDFWATEEQYFNHRNPVYKSGKGRKYGHYSQMIWRNTTHMGGAMQKCKHGGEIWVCNYNPHGNVIGEKAY